MRNNWMLKIVLTLIVVFVASIYLPEFYWKTFPHRYQLPRVYYSPVMNDILILKQNNGRGLITDREGKRYSMKQFEALVPQTNYSQLMYDGILPDSVNGVEFDIPELRKNFFRVSFRPVKIFIMDLILYPLIESAPPRPSLIYPDEFFTITDKMNVMNASINEENEVFTTLFTNALSENGFDFPPKKLFGNPTTRKAFDEGYFLVDSKDNLFHLKRVKDMPFCKKIDLPVNTKIVCADVVEKPLKEFYGFFVTEDNKLFLISYNDYKIITIPVEEYDYKNSNMNIIGDILYRTISVTNENKISVYVYDRQYNRVAEYKDTVLHLSETTQGIISAYLFPFSLSLVSEKTTFVDFYFKFNGFSFLIVNLIIVLLFILFLYVKKNRVQDNICFILLLFIVGIYGIVPVFLIRNFNQSNSPGV